MKDKGITKDSLWACLLELVTAGIIEEGSMEEEDLKDRIEGWTK